MIKSEWKNIMKTPKGIASILAIMLLPILYTGLFLWAFWDPYSNLDKLPVAIVNDDQAYNFEGENLHLGDDLVENLLDSKSFQFEEVSHEKAEQGLEEGEYYLIIEIPENFSQHATTLLDDEPSKLTINYIANEGHNFLGGQIGETAVNKIRDEVNDEVSKTYAEMLFKAIAELTTGINDASDGAVQINDGAIDVAGGADELKGHLKELASSTVTIADGSDKLKAGAQEAATGANSLQSGLGELQSGSEQLQTGAADAATGATSLNDGVNSYTEGVATVQEGYTTLQQKQAQFNEGVQQLADSTTQLQQGVDSLATGAGSIQQGATTLATGAEEAQIGADSLATGATSVSSGAGDVATGANSLATGTTNLVAGASDVATGMTDVTAGAANLAVGAESLQGGLAQLAAQMEGLQAVLPAEQYAALQGVVGELQAGSGVLVEGAKNVAAGTQSLQAGAENVATGAQSLQAGAENVATGAQSLHEGAEQLAVGAGNLSSGVGELASGAHQLAQGGTSLVDGVAQLQDGTVQLVDGAGTLATSSTQLTAGYTEAFSGVQQIAANSDSLQQGATDLASGITTLSTKIGDLTTGIVSAKTGSSDLATGLNSLVNGSTDLATGTTTLASKSDELAVGGADLATGAHELADGTQEYTTELSSATEEVGDIEPTDETYDMMASPVEVSKTAMNEVPNYGTGFAPYFISLGLAVGGLLISQIYDYVKAYRRPTSGTAWFLSKMSVLALIGFVQSALVTVVVLAIGVDVSHPWIMLALGTLTSIVFISIVQVLVTWLGDVGRFLALVVLVIQLVTSAGTFPIELIPNALQNFYGLLPMTYTVEAFRAVISTGDMHIVMQNSLIIIGFALPCIVLTYVYFVMKFRQLKKLEGNMNETVE